MTVNLEVKLRGRSFADGFVLNIIAALPFPPIAVCRIGEDARRIIVCIVFRLKGRPTCVDGISAVLAQKFLETDRKKSGFSVNHCMHGFANSFCSKKL